MECAVTPRARPLQRAAMRPDAAHPLAVEWGGERAVAHIRNPVWTSRRPDRSRTGTAGGAPVWRGAARRRARGRVLN
jgi:hypothetical protein